MPSRLRSFLFFLFASVTACTSPSPSEVLDAKDGTIETDDAIDQRCLGDTFTDNACDICQNTFCCAARFTCYDDKGCFYADIALDKCLGRVASGDAGEDGADAADCSDADARSPKLCWDDFECTNDVARARVACQREHCKTECEVP